MPEILFRKIFEILGTNYLKTVLKISKILQNKSSGYFVLQIKIFEELLRKSQVSKFSSKTSKFSR